MKTDGEEPTDVVAQDAAVAEKLERALDADTVRPVAPSALARKTAARRHRARLAERALDAVVDEMECGCARASGSRSCASCKCCRRASAPR